MSSVNKVILLGRLGKDPEVRSFANGGKVVNLRVATSERYKDKAGQQQERTEWHAVAIFDEKLGEIAERYLTKGSQVYLEGQIETRKWTDQAGQERYSTEIAMRPFRSAMTLLGGKGDGEAKPAQGGGYKASTPPGGGNPLDDDIPFAAEWR